MMKQQFGQSGQKGSRCAMSRRVCDPKQNALVCSFLTAAEYQLRFGPNAPRSNAECPQ